MKYTPYGAVGQVTGSRHLLETATAKVLLDCGMFQGEHDRPPNLNRELPIDATALDAVILSHGHIDHSGCLPLLIRQGYRGKIYCSAATRDVTELMLYDTSKIQRQDYEYRLKHDPVAAAEHTPTYSDEDVAKTMEHFESVEYGECRIVKPGFEFCLYNSGHILGSSAVHITATDDSGQITVGYTGDLGKKNMPILRGPEILPATQNLICETTYGDRVHEDLTSAEAKLIEVIEEAVRGQANRGHRGSSAAALQSICAVLCPGANAVHYLYVASSDGSQRHTGHSYLCRQPAGHRSYGRFR
jgi:metallo-beta-lactamase family protein